jgi:hypothetical protein
MIVFGLPATEIGCAVFLIGEKRETYSSCATIF